MSGGGVRSTQFNSRVASIYVSFSFQDCSVIPSVFEVAGDCGGRPVTSSRGARRRVLSEQLSRSQRYEINDRSRLTKAPRVRGRDR